MRDSSNLTPPSELVSNAQIGRLLGFASGLDIRRPAMGDLGFNPAGRSSLGYAGDESHGGRSASVKVWRYKRSAVFETIVVLCADRVRS